MNKDLIFKIATTVCSEATKEFAERNPDIKFCLYQSMEGQSFSPYDIVRFYNTNWTGNVDFMHIPDYEKTIRNIINYPIIMAYDTKKHEILGISTLQFNENSLDSVDPYFPIKGAKYFSMTGILAKSSNKDKGLRGIGSRIYQIELEVALCYKNSGYDDTRIMCVIDCRNIQSIFALMKAAEGLSRNYKLEKKHMEFPAIIDAYYYITGGNGLLTEAPTLVMEVGLEPKKIKPTNYRRMEFHPTDGDLNLSLLGSVERALKQDKSNPSVVNLDQDLGGLAVTYVPLDRDLNNLRDFPLIATNGTEMGNNRIPLKEEELINLFNGYGGNMQRTMKSPIERR